MRRIRISVHTALLATLALLVTIGAGVALGHVALVSTSPTANSTVRHAPRSVSILFGGPIRRGTLKVIGPHNEKDSIGTGARDPRNIDRLLVQMKRRLPAGRYTAYGSTIAEDTHHQTWKFSFQVR